uniref:Arf-GAP domain-containing protein n=1 Tax=Meloidogyne enterolobii TaxID=390850 RepID=A0A6V7UVP8_MELEN|nr:unnamed protein product [Meloidogyne enterolobii]
MPLPKHKAADAKKIETERLQGFLQELLREEENKYCADCEQKQPRWASWNLGVFLCIRCAGLHRNLGVHISKVKSVTLDSWTSEQVQSMRVMGNAKARAVYENELPPLFRRPQTDQSLEQFIRAKYEAKRYIMKGWIHPPVDIADLPTYPGSMVRDKKVVATFSTVPKSTSTTSKQSSQDSNSQSDHVQTEIPQLIDFVSSPKSGHFSLNQTGMKRDSNSIDDLFGPIVSAAPNIQNQQQSQLFAPQPPNLPFSQSSPNFNNANNDMFSRVFSGTEQVNVGTDQRRTSSPDFNKIPNNSLNAVNSQIESQNSIGLDLQGIDFNLCSIAGTENQVTSQASATDSTTFSSIPPASDAKKSTSEILALFNK